MAPTLVPDATAVFVVIDVQNDFCPGGSLAVPDGDAIVPTINRLATRFDHVVATQDWHPPGHLSFASSHPGKAPFDCVQLDYGEQTLWPDHCIQGQKGAEFHPDLDTRRYELVIRKGYRAGIDSYSAFCENDHITATGLDGYLRERGLSKVYMAGLAGDVCVMYSALDAAHRGFDAYVVTDACRAIGDVDAVHACEQQLRGAGVHLIGTDELLN